MYIDRYLEARFLRASKSFPVVLLCGARQVGKSTMLKKLAQNQNRTYVTLDDLQSRELAQKDPQMFFQNYKPPIIIDEVQFAPSLFSYIKIMCDRGQSKGDFWLTGSQSYLMMQNVSESLAGRVAILNMLPLSLGEVLGFEPHTQPFYPSLELLQERQGKIPQLDTQQIFEYIFNGGMPALVQDLGIREDFYHSYISTYLLRDVMQLGKITDVVRFWAFLRGCAAQIACQVNINNLAQIAEISAPTAKEWLRLLEGMGIIYLLQPYSANLLKRLSKTPKLYFADTGLCAFLCKWLTPSVLQNGAQAGAFMENFVANQLIFGYSYQSQSPNIWFYRDSNGKEVDFLLQANMEICPLEVKLACNPSTKDMQKLSAFEANGGIICMYQQVLQVGEKRFLIPAYLI